MRVVFKTIVALAAVLALRAGAAYGQVDAGVSDTDAAAPEPAQPAADAPPAAPEAPPAAVSGLVESRDPPESGGRKAARVVLYPLRGAWFLLWSPVRGFAWAYDRFAVENRVRRIFFSEDGRVGLFPIVTYKSGFGVSLGARLEIREVLAPGSRLRASATYRGEVLQAYHLRHRSGRLFGPDVQVETSIGYETFPKSRFFGIGNGDQVPGAGIMNVDALRDDTAVGTVYYHDVLAAEIAIAGDLPGPFRLRLAAGYRLRDFDDDVDVDVDDPFPGTEDDDYAISDVYDVSRLVGWQDNLATAHGDAALILNTLRQPDRAKSTAMPSTGWFLRGRLALAGALADGISGSSAAYWRWGLDVHRHIDLYGGDRVLALRLALDGVTGSLGDVPFSDLPRLGGPVLLRGYQQDRFRDRQAGVASVEYQWAIDRNVSAFVFTDVGRVWRNRDDLARGDPRVGFGGGVEIHSMKNFIARVMLASSKDGSTFAAFSFDPLFDARGRP